MLNEIINEYNISDGNADHNPYNKRIKTDRDVLKNLIKTEGQLMQNISNGKQYMVYEITALANIIGKRFGICQQMKDNEITGTILIKPMISFKPIYY